MRVPSDETVSSVAVSRSWPYLATAGNVPIQRRSLYLARFSSLASLLATDSATSSGVRPWWTKWWSAAH